MDLVSDKIAKQWIDSRKIVPSRKLQLSFEKSSNDYKQTNDFGAVLSLIKNEPSLVPQEHRKVIHNLIELIQAPIFMRRTAKTKNNPYYQTLAPFLGTLSQYIKERKQGVHQYNQESDYSYDIIKEWYSNKVIKKQQSDIELLGAADYLRIIARTIDNRSDSFLRHNEMSVPATANILRFEKELGVSKKELVKLIKKIAQNYSESFHSIQEHQDILLMFSNNRISVRPTSFIQDSKIQLNYRNDELLGSAYNLLGSKSLISQTNNSIGEFEDLLNSPIAGEIDFQRFFENYPAFILGTDYNRLVSQPILMREDERNLIPDFILIPKEFSQPKIVDLKLPTFNIARHISNREGFLSSVMTARDQLLEYRNYFCSKESSEFAKREFGCDLFLPKIAVIIGRTSSFASDYERRKIESRLSDLEVITYDDILARAKEMRNIIEK